MLTSFEKMVVLVLLILGNMYGCILLIHRVLTALFSCWGCCGASSTQSWQKALCWVFCPSCALASEARRGFQQPPNRALQPSRGPPESEPSATPCPGLFPAEENVGSLPPNTSGRSFSPMTKWKAGRKNRKRPAAPPVPDTPGSSRDECDPSPLLSGTPPPPSHGVRKSSGQEGGRPPVSRTSACPPATRRSHSSPRPSSSSHKEETTEIQLPSSNDILTGYRDLTRILYNNK